MYLQFYIVSKLQLTSARILGHISSFFQFTKTFYDIYDPQSQREKSKKVYTHIYNIYTLPFKTLCR